MKNCILALLFHSLRRRLADFYVDFGCAFLYRLFGQPSTSHHRRFFEDDRATLCQQSFFTILSSSRFKTECWVNFKFFCWPSFELFRMFSLVSKTILNSVELSRPSELSIHEFSIGKSQISPVFEGMCENRWKKATKVYYMEKMKASIHSLEWRPNFADVDAKLLRHIW